jgi:hypothetical protein
LSQSAQDVFITTNTFHQFLADKDQVSVDVNVVRLNYICVINKNKNLVNVVFHRKGDFCRRKTHFLTMTRFFRDIRHTIGQYQLFS